MSTTPNNNSKKPDAQAASNDDSQQQQTTGITVNIKAPSENGSNNNNNNNNNGSPSPNKPPVLVRDLPIGIQLGVNLLTLSLAIIVFVMLFTNIGEGWILAASEPSDVTAANFSTEARAIQIMPAGIIHFYIGALLLAIVATSLNITELFFPGVVAKHRVKQLVINRVASGLAVAVFLICLSSVPAYVARKNQLTTSSGKDAHASVLSFWILLFILSPFVMLSHRLTPNEGKRRFDREGSFDDEYSPMSHNAPDNY